MAERPIKIKGNDERSEWEVAIEHELKTVECARCSNVSTWRADYTLNGEPVTVFTCRSCGHEMHIHSAEVDQVAEEPTAT